MRRLPIYVHIDDGVYPVAEDTLLMLEAVEVRRGERFLEMGCGQGLVGLHAAKYGAETTLADIDPLAVECARRNALENDLAAEVVQSDFFEKVRGEYDVIAFNPPYLPGETEAGLRDMRLDGGEGGIEVARNFLEGAKAHLRPGGRIYLLLSSLSKREKLEDEGDWTWKRAASRALFFEELAVYILRRK